MGQSGLGQFRGISAGNIDAKGRIAVPKRYRQVIADEAQSRMVATIDTEATCLLLYTFPEWELIEQKIETLSSFNPVTRRIQRLLIGHATEMELDGQGRVLLPPLLREYAGLQKRVVMIGQGCKFELWDESHWQASRETWLKDGLSELQELPTELGDISL